MKSFAVAALCAVSMIAFTSPAFAKTTAPVIEEIDHNIMEEIDHNAISDGAAADVTIVDATTVGKPRPKAKQNKKAAKEIPLIDTTYEGRSADDVTFVTGGVGKNERAAIEASKADYNLYVTSAAATGEFVGDTNITISRKNAEDTEEMLNIDSGPLLYVRLPAGSYVLMAELNGQMKEQKFTVNAQGKPSTIHLTWKLAQ